MKPDPAAKKIVLLIEKDEILFDLVSIFLSSRGYEVIKADSISPLHNEGEKPGIVICDEDDLLPESLEALMELQQDWFFILLTSFMHEPFIKHHGISIVRKPFSAEELFRIIESKSN